MSKAQIYVFDQWLGTASLKLLIRTWALMPRLMPLMEHYSFDELITIVERALQIPKLFPKTTANIIANSLPDFLNKLDRDHFSASVIGHLLVNPSDAKPDNFQVRLIRDAITQQIEKIQIIGIDNDRALAHPLIRQQVKRRIKKPITKETKETGGRKEAQGIEKIKAAVKIKATAKQQKKQKPIKKRLQ